MKLSVTKFSIEHLVATGCTDIIVDGIKALEAEIAELKAEVDKLTPKKLAFFTWTDKTFIDKVEFDKLQAENERICKLFAETERLMLLDGEYEAMKVGTYSDLQAELERLTKEYSDATNHYNKLHNNLQAEVDRLKATMEKVISTADKIDEQNQRLRKAGDAMCRVMVSHHGKVGVVDDWNAAKGVQS